MVPSAPVSTSVRREQSVADSSTSADEESIRQLSRSAHFGRISDTSETSLSPRPERHWGGRESQLVVLVSTQGEQKRTMTMLASLGSVLAISIVPQMACAVSRAGMMPSISVQARKPRRHCSSVAETYSARPLSFNQACCKQNARVSILQGGSEKRAAYLGADSRVVETG